MRADVAVVGGGLGGVAATLAAVEQGLAVILSEETDWLGGQLTAQGVPPDEHPWIEQFGCTASYRRLRDAIRDYYRRWYPLTAEARARRELNPGAGWVSKLCHEPRVALAVIEALLAPHRSGGRLQVLTRHRPVDAAVDSDRVTSVTLLDLHRDERVTVEAGYVLDATETGELLPLAGAEYVTGFESQAVTGEPSAPAEPQPLNMQAVSVCFALEHLAGEDHTIGEPDDYADWRHRFSFTAPDPKTLEPVRHTFSPNPDLDPGEVIADQRAEHGARELWLFRRIAARLNFVPGAYSSDITLVNWPMIDYVGGPLFELAVDQAAFHAAAARRQSRAFLYWLQTEAPRPDGGSGYPGLRIRRDVLGTADGFAKAPYIRESRRIAAQYTITEQDLSLAIRGEAGAVRYADSVGIGAYRIDLHPSTGGDPYLDIGACPFRLPLGALLPVRMRNLLPAAKNIGTTHITNGCYRLHPTEWNVGEVAGLLAAHCLRTGIVPEQVRADPHHLTRFQSLLVARGVELDWPDVRGY